MEADLQRVGYQVSLARYDDQGQADAAAEHALSIAYDQEVVGVVGSFTSLTTAALAEGLQESGVAVITPTAGDDNLLQANWLHLNRLVATDARLEAEAAAYARERLGSRSILLLLDGSAEADRRAAAFETAAQIVSLPVAGRLILPAATNDATLAAAVRAAGVDALYYAGDSQKGHAVATALRREGVTVPIIGGPALYNPAFEADAGSGWRGVYFAHFTEGTDGRFMRHFETILGKPTRGYGMFGYDAARVILEALIRYGEEHPGEAPDRTELAALVRDTRGLQGWSTSITFDAGTGENQASQVYIFEWVDGRYELRQ